MPSLVYPVESVLLATVGVAWLAVVTFIYSDAFMALDTVVLLSGFVLACLNLLIQIVYPPLEIAGDVLVWLSLALAVTYAYGLVLSTGSLAVPTDASCSLPDAPLEYSRMLFGNVLLYQAEAALSLALLLVQVCVSVAGSRSQSPWWGTLWTRPWVALLSCFHGVVLATLTACEGSSAAGGVMLVLTAVVLVSPVVIIVPQITAYPWITPLVFFAVDFCSFMALSIMAKAFNMIQVVPLIIAFAPPLLANLITIIRIALEAEPSAPQTESVPAPAPAPSQQDNAKLAPPPMVPQSGFHVPEMALFRNITIVREHGDTTKKQT